MPGRVRGGDGPGRHARRTRTRRARPARGARPQPGGERPRLPHAQAGGAGPRADGLAGREGDGQLLRLLQGRAPARRSARETPAARDAGRARLRREGRRRDGRRPGDPARARGGEGQVPRARDRAHPRRHVSRPAGRRAAARAGDVPQLARLRCGRKAVQAADFPSVEGLRRGLPHYLPRLCQPRDLRRGRDGDSLHGLHAGRIRVLGLHGDGAEERRDLVSGQPVHAGYHRVRGKGSRLVRVQARPGLSRSGRSPVPGRPFQQVHGARGDEPAVRAERHRAHGDG